MKAARMLSTVLATNSRIRDVALIRGYPMTLSQRPAESNLNVPTSSKYQPQVVISPLLEVLTIIAQLSIFR